MTASIHGIIVESNNRKLFKFGYLNLIHYVEEGLLAPSESKTFLNTVVVNGQLANQISSRCNKLHTTLNRLLRCARWLVDSIDSASVWFSMTSDQNLPHFDWPRYSLEDTSLFYEMFITYLRVLVDDIASSMWIFYFYQNRSAEFPFRKFNHLYTNRNNLSDSTLRSFLNSMGEENWFTKLNKIRNSLVHGSTQILLTSYAGAISPMVSEFGNDHFTSISSDLLEVIQQLFQFMDLIFYNYYSILLPTDRQNMEEYCISRGYRSLTSASDNLLEIFPQIS